MFRVTQYLQELKSPSPLGPKRNPPGPVVIWNLIRRCNLACQHCYSISADIDFAGELSTPEIFATMDDLKAFGVPVLILSGGEPLLHRDIFSIAARAKAMGFYVGLSTNGTLIDDAMLPKIAAVGFDYVGISLDGIEATHDRFRRKVGAFAASLAGVRRCRDAGIKVGLRFTLTRDNAHDLPALLELMEAERIDKFYLSHLNYGGRGNINRKTDAMFRTTRDAMDLLFDTAWRHLEAGRPREFVTGNNDADAAYLLHWARRRFGSQPRATTQGHSTQDHSTQGHSTQGHSTQGEGWPEREARLRAKLAQWGGNASGVNVANIDNLGNVHPDTFWWDYTLGNVRERPFSAIWRDPRDPLLAGMRMSPRPVKGRCRECSYFDVCGGNTRVRSWQLTGDAWAEDPGCYLDDDELGIEPGRARVALRPYVRVRRADASQPTRPEAMQESVR